MEMENSRRSIDRSREPGLKKPRLVEDVERDRSSNGIIDRGDRSFPSRVSAGAATGPQGSRFRTNDREGDAYHPQQQQQHQELVSRYKTALAELTFNSKPIITNLTIIAGENLHAAKWIAATVCANILEVPSEQKLPSLYLLDSIVKNIGRDYIKYFAARLPEVFCKAYRQVDPSIHPGMRHLFGTWKGVFPIACLQSIEKELGFPPATNGSSSGAATSRADSQAQRPPHSIHVNPKYLEARQRLQQSSRDFKQPQREVSREPVIEKSNSTDFEDYEYSSDFSRHSDLGFGRVDEKVTEQEEIDKPWYGAGKNATEAAADQRNALGGQRELSKYRAPKPVPPVAKLPPAGLTTNAGKRSSTAMNRNWKNSEEEEYMWDDMNSRLTDHGGPRNSRKDGWNTDDAEKLEVEDHFMQPRGEPDTGSRTSRESSADSYSIAQRGQLFGHRPSMLLMREPQTEDSLKHTGVSSTVSAPSEVQRSSLGVFSASIGSSVARTGRQTNMQLSVGDVPSFGSFMNIGSSGGGLAQQRHQPPYPISPSRHQSVQQSSHLPSSSALRQQQVSHNFTELDHLQDSSMSQSGQKASQIAGQLNRAPPMQTNQEPFPTITKSKPVNLQNLQPSQIPPPRNIQTAPMHFPQQRNHSSFSQQSHSELRQSQPFGQIQKHLPHTTFGTPESGHSMSDHSSNPATDVPGQSSTGSLLAAIMKSGLLSNNSVSGGITNVSFQESGTVPPHLNIQPPLPSGPPPAQLATSTSMVAPISLPASHGRTSPKTDPQRTAVLPPLPPGPPPSSSILGSSQTGGATNSESNPLSSLLSSLVAKGLISKPAKEPTSITASEVPSMPQNQNSSIPTSSSMLVSLVPASSTIPQPSSGKEPPLSETAAKGTTASSQVIAMEKKGLIGIEFKPEVIRESHPGVISDLLADLLHRCDICGLRLKLQERLDRHLEWHASKKHDSSGNNNNTMSRRWYASLDNWVTGSAGCPYPTTEGLVKIEENEPMVPADETQAVCVLCGELFEDFYSHERDEWMYKGAVYMTIPVSDVGAMDDSSGQGPIVHDKCISPSSAYDLGLAKNVGKGNAEG